MSIQSRQRHSKRPNQQCRKTHQPGPNLGLIPFKPIGLFRVGSSRLHHNGQPHGKLGGVSRLTRLLRKLAEKVQFVAP